MPRRVGQDGGLAVDKACSSGGQHGHAVWGAIMQIIGLVIHLARATARRAVADQLVADCATDFGVPARILDAADGRALEALGDLASYRLKTPLKPRFPFTLGAGEKGCFLSHRAAWTALLVSDAEAALILEDDVALGPLFAEALALARRHLPDMGYIQFQTRAVSGAAPVDHQGEAVLYRPQITPLRTSGQLVNRATATRLLDLTRQFDRPVDTFLQMHWHTGLHLGAIAPSGLSDVSATSGGSTLSTRKPLLDKLRREVQRLRYRRAVARMSQAGGL